ncbi:MAG: major capsid protein [Arizlama microvirus]|nr:MAG: major capsid protein [Arizlama microvirus]
MRNEFNLSHLSHTAGHIGRIQSLTIIPVEAGSSLQINLDGIARLAPNRKEIVSECQIDICAFFVPHRIVYGQDWIDFINSGPDETKTFTGVAVGAGYRNPEWLCLPTCGATINRSLLEGYNRIYANFYAVPSLTITGDGQDPQDFDWYPTTETGAANARKYGYLAARLPHVLNGGNLVYSSGATGWETQDLNDTDYEVPVTGGVFDLRDLQQFQSRLNTEAANAWFSRWYQDVMKEKWGSEIGPDVDPRNLKPHLLMRQTQMMSGKDIDGTDDATLGSFQGKTLERVAFNMPRKYFAEHGNVYVLALLRYPLVHTREQHPLLASANFSYDEIAADPGRLASLAPVAYDPSPWLAGGSSYGDPSPLILQQPYGQHYRFQPNRVHPNFAQIPGYPFSDYDSVTFTGWYYYLDEEYKETFQTTQIGQWQIQALVNCTKYSPVPGVKASIFAGTR